MSVDSSYSSEVKPFFPTQSGLKSSKWLFPDNDEVLPA